MFSQICNIQHIGMQRSCSHGLSILLKHLNRARLLTEHTVWLSASQHQLHHLYPEDLQHGDYQSHDCQSEGVEVWSSSADFCPKKLSRIKHQEGCQGDMVVIQEEAISDTPAGLWKARHHAYSKTWASRKARSRWTWWPEANQELRPEDNPSACVGL